MKPAKGFQGIYIHQQAMSVASVALDVNLLVGHQQLQNVVGLCRIGFESRISVYAAMRVAPFPAADWELRATCDCCPSNSTGGSVGGAGGSRPPAASSGRRALAHTAGPVVVTLGNGHAALVSLGDHIGEQGMKTPLRFFTIPQIAKPAPRIFIAQSQGEKSNALFSKGCRQPLDVLCQGVGLFLSRARQWAIFLFLFLLTCSCYK
jgi:hypothetical protein